MSWRAGQVQEGCENRWTHLTGHEDGCLSWCRTPWHVAVACGGVGSAWGSAPEGARRAAGGGSAYGACVMCGGPRCATALASRGRDCRVQMGGQARADTERDATRPAAGLGSALCHRQVRRRLPAGVWWVGACECGFGVDLEVSVREAVHWVERWARSARPRATQQAVATAWLPFRTNPQHNHHTHTTLQLNPAHPTYPLCRSCWRCS